LQAFRFEFFVDASDQPLTDGNATDSSSGHSSMSADRIAIGYLLPSGMSDTFGKSIMPLFSKTQMPIGQLTGMYFATCTALLLLRLPDCVCPGLLRHHYLLLRSLV
jgi:hypothetical protein